LVEVVRDDQLPGKLSPLSNELLVSALFIERRVIALNREDEIEWDFAFLPGRNLFRTYLTV